MHRIKSSMTEILKASHTGRPRVLQPAGKLPPEWSGNGVMSSVLSGVPASPRRVPGPALCLTNKHGNVCPKRNYTLHLNLKIWFHFEEAIGNKGLPYTLTHL